MNMPLKLLTMKPNPCSVVRKALKALRASFYKFDGVVEALREGIAYRVFAVG
jgi:hypothetical protein